jgi:tRNA(Ile2) C34 agmatinyltransferase TiaS
MVDGVICPECEREMKQTGQDSWSCPKGCYDNDPSGNRLFRDVLFKRSEDTS